MSSTPWPAARRLTRASGASSRRGKPEDTFPRLCVFCSDRAGNLTFVAKPSWSASTPDRRSKSPSRRKRRDEGRAISRSKVTGIGGISFYLPSTRSIPETSSSNLGRGSFPVRSVSRDLSREMICDTLATESFGSPVTRVDKLTLPGARAHFRLPVSGTQTTVEIRLWLSASPCTTATGRRNSGPEPVGAGKSAHQISPCEITTRSAPAVCGKPPLRRDRSSHRFRPEPHPWPR